MIDTAVAPLFQINIVVSDMASAQAFYARLGWEFDTPIGEHASATMPNGFTVDLDTREFAGQWNAGYAGGTGGSTVLNVAVGARARVDELYSELVGAGHHGRQPPFDAFWGSRYAIVEDPDGTPIGLMSAREP